MRMKKPNRGITEEAVIIWKKKTAAFSLFPYVTRQGDIAKGILSNERVASMKSGGYLRPFSHVYLTVSPDGDVKTIQQVDGKAVIHGLETSFDALAYISFLGELITKLFETGGGHSDLFRALVRFIQVIGRKPLPLGVIIFGWQLVAMAGYTPQAREFLEHKELLKKEIAQSTGLHLTDRMMECIGCCILYNWEKEMPIAMGKEEWIALEKTLYQFVQCQLGEKLESVAFIKKTGVQLFQ